MTDPRPGQPLPARASACAVLLCPRANPDPALLAALTRRSVHLSIVPHTIDAMAALCADAAATPDRPRLLILCATHHDQPATPAAAALQAAALLCRAARAYVPRVSLWTFTPAPLSATMPTPRAAPQRPDQLTPGLPAQPGLHPLPDHLWHAWINAAHATPDTTPDEATDTLPYAPQQPLLATEPRPAAHTPRLAHTLNGAPDPIPFPPRNVREARPGPRLVSTAAISPSHPQPAQPPSRIEVHQPVSLSRDELAMLLGDPQPTPNAPHAHDTSLTTLTPDPNHAHADDNQPSPADPAPPPHRAQPPNRAPWTPR